MRALFVLHYPGYLRYFDSVIEALVERGHEVSLAFESLEKQREGLEGLAAFDGLAALDCSRSRVRVIGRLPRRTDAFEGLARAVRTTVDYLRYHHPDFADCVYLRERMARTLPAMLRPLTGLPRLSPRTLALLYAVFGGVEKSVPRSRRIDRFLAAAAPDLVIVSPLVTDGSVQVEVVKSAAARGIPSALCVASWDHLTTKGLIRTPPDRVLVWNEAQKKEAMNYHGVAPNRIAVTGAQPFDRWFGRGPSLTRDEFCARSGLCPTHPIVLFVGSTASIAPPRVELDFVRRWTATLRGHQPLERAGLLVRPHPYNRDLWADAGRGGDPDVVVWPRHGANPVAADDRTDYFDSLHHADAVVGINTSAMVEAAILGRPVHTVLAREFEATQRGTRHFHHLLPENGGPLIVARDLDEHAQLVAGSLRDPDSCRERDREFVAEFLRPAGLDEPCTPRVVEVLERLAEETVPRRVMPRYCYPLSAMLGMVALTWRTAKRIGARRRLTTEARRARRKHGGAEMSVPDRGGDGA